MRDLINESYKVNTIFQSNKGNHDELCNLLGFAQILVVLVPGVGEDAAAADSHGLAVVSMSIGATSEGSEWSFKDDQAVEKISSNINFLGFLFQFYSVTIFEKCYTF